MNSITIKVGKTYECRNGAEFKALEITHNEGKTYRVRGEDEKGRITWRSLKGRFDKAPHALDVVREKA